MIEYAPPLADALSYRPLGEIGIPREAEPLPPDFFVGIATAAYQTEGHTPDSVPAAWDVFTAERGLTPAGEGIGAYEHWKEQIRLMQEAGITDFRTSISMSRILKEDGSVNMEAIEWYKRFFQATKDAGIKIYATLYHWELPAHLSGEQGGWKNRKTIDSMVAHARAVATHLDKYIEEYFMFNEPWCSALLSYHLGYHAPGETDLKGALQAAHNILVAHGRVYDEIKGIRPEAKISTVLNMEPAYPASERPEDQEAAQLADGYYNKWFIDPLFTGKYPEDMVAFYSSLGFMPDVEDGDMELMHVGPKLHSLGINNYRAAVVAAAPSYDPDYIRTHAPYDYVTITGEPLNDLDWPIYPPAIHDILIQVWERYRHYGLQRVYITENGMASDEPNDSDDRRIAYLRENLHHVLRAIKKGVPVKAYFAWTLADNFEWGHGYKPGSRFGLASADRRTGLLMAKKSLKWLKDVIAGHKLPAVAA
jgi:beta-glucosidase